MRTNNDKRTITLAGLLAGAILWGGCQGTVGPNEQAARQNAAAVARVYRPAGPPPNPSRLSPNASLHDWLGFALRRQPAVEAAYQDWLGAVERITVARSLPDPRLTFELDITTVVESVMPGLMMDFPGPGKLRARADVASAESEARYFDFAARVLQTAYDLKKAYYQWHFLSERLRVSRNTLALLTDLEQLARQRSEVGAVTLQDVLRAQIEQEQMRTEIANLEDARGPLAAQFKAALGLRADEPDPPLPSRFEPTPSAPEPEALLATTLAQNPRLQAMAAEVRLAEASLRLAAKSRVPDFTAGVEADALASPVMGRPSFSVTLPIWRDKIAAEIAGAQAGKRAAAARLSAAQIELAVELAEKSFMYREAERNLELVREAVLPKARQALEVARAAYLTGRADFLDVLDAERTVLGFERAEIEAQTQRELALAALSLVIAGVPPPAAPLLSTAATPSPPEPPRSSKSKKESHAP